jgi:hypothetical protein
MDDQDVKCCCSCGFQFNVLVRRHHCRACGKLFCKFCTESRWALPRFEYHSPVRVCNECSFGCEMATSLVDAICSNNMETITKFVTRGGNCNLHIGIYPPLTVAAMEGSAEICKLLLSGGADVNHAVTTGGGRGGAKDAGLTALHASVCKHEQEVRFKSVYNNTEVIRLLASYGAQVCGSTVPRCTCLWVGGLLNTHTHSKPAHTATQLQTQAQLQTQTQTHTQHKHKHKRAVRNSRMRCA